MAADTVSHDPPGECDLSRADASFAAQIAAEPGCDTLVNCFQCGLCTGTCPVAELDDRFSPAWIIQWVRLGLKEAALGSPLIWYCLQCHRCSFHCPQGVRFADIDAALRARAVEEGWVTAERARHLAALEEAWRRERLRGLDRFFANPPNAALEAPTPRGTAAGAPEAGDSSAAAADEAAQAAQAAQTEATGGEKGIRASAAADAAAEADGFAGPPPAAASGAAEQEADRGAAFDSAADGEDLDWGTTDSEPSGSDSW